MLQYRLQYNQNNIAGGGNSVTIHDTLKKILLARIY